MLNLLTGLKGQLIMYAVLIAFGGFKTWQSASLKKEVAHNELKISVLESANENWRKTVEALQKEAALVTKIKLAAEAKAVKIEADYHDRDIEIITLRAKYEKVKLFVDSTIPGELADELCKRYSKGRKDNKTKATGGATKENRSTCTRELTTRALLTYVSKLNKTVDLYESRMDALAAYYSD